jgi:hypothetical protein
MQIAVGEKQGIGETNLTQFIFFPCIGELQLIYRQQS